jgi:hypothetical protein
MTPCSLEQFAGTSFVTLKMEAAGSSKTLVYTDQNTWHQIPGNHKLNLLNTHHTENLSSKSYGNETHHPPTYLSLITFSFIFWSQPKKLQIKTHEMILSIVLYL